MDKVNLWPLLLPLPEPESIKQALVEMGAVLAQIVPAGFVRALAKPTGP